MRSILVTFRPKRSQTLQEWTGQLDAIIFFPNTNRIEINHEYRIASYTVQVLSQELQNPLRMHAAFELNCWIF